MNTDYTSDSDLSEDTRDLVDRGLASVKRKRRTFTILDSNMDTSNVRHPSGRIVPIGDTSTHGLTMTDVETVISQNHNNSLHLMYIPYHGIQPTLNVVDYML